MNILQPQYPLASTFLELVGNKKLVHIEHPVHGKHCFPLPTKEEISKDYSYKESPKKKWINSFMIFRTYLQKSKENYLTLSSEVSEVSKIASDAWTYASEDVLKACNELETELKEGFKYKRFVPYSPYSHQNHQNPKKSRKIKSSPSKKKQGTSLSNAIASSVYPSPPPSMPSMTATPIPFSDLTYYSPYVLTPGSLETVPTCMIGVPMPSLTIGPPLLTQEPETYLNQFSSALTPSPILNTQFNDPLTPSQILNQNFLGSELISSTPSSLEPSPLTPLQMLNTNSLRSELISSTSSSSDTNSLREGPILNTSIPTQITVTLNETVAEPEVTSMRMQPTRNFKSIEDEKKCIKELFNYSEY